MTEPGADLAFVDCETTRLDVERLAWNIAVIRRRPDGVETGEEIIVRDVDLSRADPMGLLIGHFWQRHPEHGGDPGDATIVEDEAEAAAWLETMVRPSLTPGGRAEPVHIVGAVPSFDVHTFEPMFRRHGLCWPAHYHLVDAECVAVGALAARGILPRFPYSGEDLTTMLGLDPAAFAKHTALGDARWARALFDAAITPVGALSGARS